MIKDSLAYTIKDLKPSITYRFRVLAENIHGRSEPSQCSEDVQMSLPIDSRDDADMNADTKFTIRPVEQFKTRFQIQEELGKGKYGIVHRVTENGSGRVMAAKTVKCIMAAQKAMVSIENDWLNNRWNGPNWLWIYLQINEEISIMQSLKHSKLLQLFDVFEAQREIILILE